MYFEVRFLSKLEKEKESRIRISYKNYGTHFNSYRELNRKQNLCDVKNQCGPLVSASVEHICTHQPFKGCLLYTSRCV